VRNVDGATCAALAQKCDEHGLIAKQLDAVLQGSAASGSSVSSMPAGGGKADIESGVVARAGKQSGRQKLNDGKAKTENLSVKEKFLKETLGGYKMGLFWLICVSCVVIQYILDVRDEVWGNLRSDWPWDPLVPWVALAFELTLPFCLLIFFYICRGDPGKVPASNIGRAPGVEAMLRILKEGFTEIDSGRLCTTTWVLKGLRTKYCATTGLCIREFDHFCDFTNCPIGRQNHRQFIVLAFLEPFAQWLHIWLCGIVASRAVGYPTGIWGLCAWYAEAAARFPMMIPVGFLHLFSLPFMAYLCSYQVFCIANNITMNEFMNKARYEHFWVAEGGGGVLTRFVSPFCKGSFMKNIVDFWWWRRREEGPGCNDKVGCLALALLDAGAQ